MEIMRFEGGEGRRAGDGKGRVGGDAVRKALRRSLSAVRTAPEVVKTAKRMKEPWRSRIWNFSVGLAVGKVVSSIGSGMSRAGMGYMVG